VVFFFYILKISDVARGAAANYNTMTISQIKEMPIKDISDPNGAILALWIPSCLLQEGLDVMKAWGFKHKQTYIWVKHKKNPLLSLLKTFGKEVVRDGIKKAIINTLGSFSVNSILAFGMGRLFRQTHEIALIGINNKKIYSLLENKSQRSVSLDLNLKHSKKPDHLQNSLELMFPTAEKIEIFARREKEGWTCLGNEVCNGEDIYDSIAKLL
jgi:N6-adenosine-specific RNA methylase IME4